MQDGLEPLQIKENRPIEVRVFAGHTIDPEYQVIGDGYFDLATDFLIPAPQHYIEVTDPKINQLILRSRLQKTNGYQRKKNTIIAWFDPEQVHEKDIAISFLHKEDCNRYWKLICSKIGKDYLQINRNERLEKPSKNNSQHLLEKAKASYELVAFNMINSEQFVQCLWKVFDTFLAEDNKEGIENIKLFLKEILSHWDPKIMRVLLKTENFQHFLLAFQCTYIKNSQKKFEKKSEKKPSKNSIILEQYKKLGKFKQIAQMSDALIKEIEIGIKGNFFREMLNFNELFLDHDDIVRMVDEVLKESYMTILNLIIQQKIIHQINENYQSLISDEKLDSHHKFKEFERIVMFFKQIYTLIWYLDSFKIKQEICAVMRNQQNLQMFARILDFGCHQILEILTMIVKEDRLQFFKAYKENYRSNSKYNLNLIIANTYIKSQNESVKEEILRFYKEILTEIDSSRQNYEYFNGTILVTGFDRCSNLYWKLSFASLVLSKLESHHFVSIMNHFLRKGLVDAFAKYLPDETRSSCSFPPKHVMLELVKILKIIIYRENAELRRKIGLSEKGQVLLQHQKDQFSKRSQRDQSLMRSQIGFLLQLHEKTQQHVDHERNQFSERDQFPKIPQREELPSKTSQQIDEQRKIHKAIIEGKIVYLCFQYLEHRWESNNLVTSSILQIVQNVANYPYTLFTKYIQEQYTFDLTNKKNTPLERYVNLINQKVKPPSFNIEEEKGSDEAETHHLKAHKHRLEQQIQEQYLLGEQNNDDSARNYQNEALNQNSLLQLMKMKKQIQMKNEDKDEPKAVVESMMQEQEFDIKFDLPDMGMEEQEIGKQKSEG